MFGLQLALRESCSFPELTRSLLPAVLVGLHTSVHVLWALDSRWSLPSCDIFPEIENYLMQGRGCLGLQSCRRRNLLFCPLLTLEFVTAALGNKYRRPGGKLASHTRGCNLSPAQETLAKVRRDGPCMSWQSASVIVTSLWAL